MKKTLKYDQFITESVMQTIRQSNASKIISGISALTALSNVAKGEDPEEVRTMIKDKVELEKFDKGLKTADTKWTNIDQYTRAKLIQSKDTTFQFERDRGPEQYNKTVMEKDVESLDINKDTERLEMAFRKIQEEVNNSDAPLKYSNPSIKVDNKEIATNVEVKKVGNDYIVIFDFIFKDSDTKLPKNAELNKPHSMLAGKVRYDVNKTIIVERKVVYKPVEATDIDKGETVVIDIKNIRISERKERVAEITNIASKFDKYQRIGDKIMWENNAIFMNEDDIIKNLYKGLIMDDEKVQKEIEKDKTYFEKERIKIMSILK